jgi:hypothetical protein
MFSENQFLMSSRLYAKGLQSSTLLYVRFISSKTDIAIIHRYTFIICVNKVWSAAMLDHEKYHLKERQDM